MRIITQHPLTGKQKDFLRDYLPELSDECRTCLDHKDITGFTKAVLDSDFDDGETCDYGKIKTAQSLLNRGLLSELDIHTDISGGKHIYCQFSEFGAHVLFDLGCANVLKSKPLRIK